MTDKNTVLQVLGALMAKPQYLSHTDKYILTPDDFQTKLDKYIFAAIDGLYRNGATRIAPIDIEGYLKNNASARVTFETAHGIEYLQDAQYYTDEDNFLLYYRRLKKISLLNSLQKMGVDTSEFFIEDETKPEAFEVNKNFEELTIEKILQKVKSKILKLEQNYSENDEIQSWNIEEEVDDVIDSFGASEGIGLPVNGDIFSHIINGAELGALTIRSSGSGGGKSAQAVADACRLAFPFYYDDYKKKWVRVGNTEPVLFIMTEQKPEQIIQMVLGYLTGIERSRFRYGDFSKDELERIEVAREIIKHYKTLKLMRIPDPSIEQIKNIVREQVILYGSRYVFYDYIFISPKLLEEFRGHGLRNDELLLLMATALKDLAIEQNVCVFTSTQVNAKADDNTDIRNEASLAGGRATINKADNGVICARPTKDEIEILNQDGVLDQGIIPDMVTDVFKVRSGRWTQVRIWSQFNAGTLRKRDLFATDRYMRPIPELTEDEARSLVNWELSKEDEEFLEEINKKGKN